MMKLGEQWEIEMPGFGKMTVSSQINKQTDWQKNGQFTNRYKQNTDKQMVTPQRNANKWSALKQTQTWANQNGDSKIDLIPIQYRSEVTIFL